MIKADFQLIVSVTHHTVGIAQQWLKLIFMGLCILYTFAGHAVDNQSTRVNKVNKNPTLDYQAVNGGVLVIPFADLVKTESDSITGTFQGRRGFIYNNVAYFSVGMDTSPGTYQVQLNNDGHTQSVAVNIASKEYTEQHITIENQNMVTPPKETLQRISEEASKQRKLYKSYTPQIELGDGFKIPLEGPLTSLFGHKRFFNGQARNPHSGLDIAAPTGTPISAPANGTVVLVDDLYFNGNTVFIDHGQGLITMYCHMDKTSVTPGQFIKQGETLGLVGATGRVTGPHLHWSVSLGGIRIDPQIFMSALNNSSGN